MAEKTRNLNLRIFVGNFPFTWTEDNLRQLFEPLGEVLWVSLIKDPQTERPRGFGFVEMSEAEGRKAIEALDGSKHEERILRVNIARAKTPRD